MRLIKKSSILLFYLMNLALCWPNFQLYTRKNLDKYQEIDSVNHLSSNFDPNQSTYLLIHGFGDNGNITILKKVKDELLKKFEHNVIIVDWEQGAAAPNYFKASSNTRITAERIATFLTNAQIDPKSIHCIGHSLGAHICGFAGKLTKFRRISGLDPAGPIFGGTEPADRLDKTDADYVDVIHTDRLYGIADMIGHKDFFPNGGKIQHGCDPFSNFFSELGIGKRSLSTRKRAGLFKAGHKSDSMPKFDVVRFAACSHFRVVDFYAESINSSCEFTGYECDKYNDYKKGKCKNGLTAPMGFYSDLVPYEGAFYLDTNKSEPYCLN